MSGSRSENVRGVVVGGAVIVFKLLVVKAT